MFAEHLKKLRKEKKMSQVTLATKLGISQQAVGKWETGRSAPDPFTLQKVADIFDVSVDLLLGREEASVPDPDEPSEEVLVPVIGTVRAGYGALAFQENYGDEPADVNHADDYFYLVVNGDSMEPRIHHGDLALIKRQPDVNSGELAVVIVNGEEGTLKRVIKKGNTVMLQPFNQQYETQIYVGEEILQLSIAGKVIETKTKW